MKRRARTGSFPVLFFVLASTAAPLHAQLLVRTWLPWRTIETRHFAFHYPVELEAWTQDVASRADAIDSAVARLVGYAPSRRTNVVVDDPYQIPNGMAWPFLDWPVITLWASPPTPRDDIGDYRSWGEMLVTHEFAHIAHLTRPTRNPTLAAVLGALPVRVSPVTLRTPRWAYEGYATFVEGRVTGSGRPHAAWRAALLRQWALEGQLPRYEQLDASAAYEGGAFAYLAGSAFLEWLAEKKGDSSLVQVWRRLSARQNRDFNSAFTGVFGETPAVLYGRFSTDVVGKAIEVARLARTSPADTGEIVQRLARSTGDPGISHDGRRVALVIRSATAPSRVVVWSTAPEPDTLRRRRDSLLLRRDPEDVPAQPIYPPPKRALATLKTRGATPYESPRFLRDGRILLSRATPRTNGTTVTDLYLWNPSGGGVRRLTHNASVLNGDPLPGGDAAVATRCRGGWCDLVLVGFDDGVVTRLIAGNPEHSFFRPRISPSGTTVLVSVHQAGRWRLGTVDLVSRELTIVDPPDGANRYDAAWLDADEVVTTSDRGGIANLERLNLRTLAIRQLTSVTGAAVAAEPNRADSSIWFLSLYARGYDVRRLARSASPPTPPLPRTIDSSLVPALSPRPQPRPQFGGGDVSPPRAFGLTPRLFRWIPQPSLDADGVSGGLSLVSRDVIGRSELTATFASGDVSAWRGGSVTGLWFGTRPGIRVEGFVASQNLNESRSPILSEVGFDTQLAGGEVSLDGTGQGSTWAGRYRLGGSAGNQRPSTSRRLAFVDGAIAVTQRGDLVSFTESVGGTFTGGRSFDSTFYRSIVTASLSASGRLLLPLPTLSAVYGRTTTSAPLFEQFALGGGPSIILDRALLSQRVAMPVLPTGTRIGTSVFAYRAALVVGAAFSAPVSAYLWSGSTGDEDNDRFDEWQRVIGLDWTLSIPAVPAAGTPAGRAQIGIGESLDAPFRRRVRAYFSLVLNP
jgi:hypothetical protein